MPDPDELKRQIAKRMRLLARLDAEPIERARRTINRIEDELIVLVKQQRKKDT